MKDKVDKPRNAYERLVLELGEAGAREEMRLRRSKVKKSGFKGNSEEARRVAKIRWSKYAEDNKSEGTKNEVASR